ncbi:hypothetical protein V9L05_20610 [Bernardetia sp. Wsw4-3y2]|uniref:hypothetical protein n=1 Tax=Bernardetia sp. Wsw4-3y2 TaxID=3127471 RepID=UPI0030CEF113
MEEIKISTSKSQKELDELIAKLKKVGKEANLSEKEIDEMLTPLEKQKLPNATKQTEKLGGGMGKLGGIAKGVGAAFVAAFAVENLIRFANEVMNIEKEFTTLNAQVSRFSGLTGTALDKTTSKVAALAKTYGKDLNEVLIATNSFAKQSEISFDEALTLMQKGFLQGADASGDFLDKVKEYPIQFKNSGRSAEEFIKVATQEVKGGIYSDKLLDTLKEFELAIKEMDKAQQDALNNAFGKKWTDEFVNSVNTGKITTEEAFFQIASKAKESGLTVQQTQKLTADLFKGAGEDAGGFLAIIEQVDAAYKINLDTLDEYGKSQENTLKLETELADQKVRLAENLEGLSKSYDTLTTQLLTDVINAFNLVYEAIFKADTLLKKNKKEAETYGEGFNFSQLTIEIQATEAEIKRLDKVFKELDKTTEDGITFKQEEIQNEVAVLETKLKSLKGNLENLNKENEKNPTGWVETNKAITVTNKLTDDQIKKQIALNEAINDSFEKLKAQAELYKAGGDDSEAGLALLQKRAIKELEAELGFIKLNEEQKALLKEQLQVSFEERRQALILSKQQEYQATEKEMLDARLVEISDFYKHLDNVAKGSELSTEELKGILIGNLIAQLEAQKEVLLSEGESILEIETQLTDARLALKDYETEMFQNSEQKKQDAIQTTIDKEIEAFAAISSISQDIGSLFGEQGQKFGQYVQSFVALSQQLNTVAKTQIATSQAVTSAKTAEGVARASALPFPANIAAITTTLSTVISAFKTVNSFGRSKYYWGKDEITQGMGDRDDVPAYLRKGEGIVPVHINKMLKANGLSVSKLPELLRKSHSPNVSTSTISEVSLDQSAINDAISKQPHTTITLDENGFSKRVLKNGNEIIYHKNRYQ